MSEPKILDVETTGLDVYTHRIIEIAIVGYDTGEIYLDTRVNPLVFIPDEITKITGITDTDVRDAPTFAMIAERVAELIHDAESIIGYNPHFDQGMIDNEMRRLSPRPRYSWPIVVCAKQVWDTNEPRESRNLANAYRRFVNRDGYEGRHGARADALATRDVIRSQIEQFSLHEKRWDEFDPNRKKWWGVTFHVVVADSEDHLVLNFGKHKKTPVHEIDDGFWRWVIDKDFPDHVMALAIKMRELIPQWNEPENLKRALWSWAKDSQWRTAR